MQEREVSGGTAALGAVLKAQAEGFGLMAWMGAALMDHAARMGSEISGFTREQTRRDIEALRRLATCRSPETAAELHSAYWDEKAAALSAETERLAHLNAHMCDLTQKRLSDWQG